MMNEQDRFNDIIKEKLEKVDAPFNESHWEEMSNKLDQAGFGDSPSQSIFSNKYFLGAAAGVAIIAGWYFMQENEPSIDSIDDQPIVQESVVSANDINTNANETIVSEPKKSEQIENETVENTEVITTSELDSEPEEIVENMADITEDAHHEKGSEAVDQLMKSHQTTMGETPKIDNPVLKTEILIKDKVICQGEKISFDIDREIDGTSYAWNFGDNGLTSRKKNPQHAFKKAGTYTVTLIVSNTGREKDTYKAEKQIVVGKTPVIEFKSEQNAITLEHPYAAFKVSTDVPCEFLWKFNEKDVASGSEVQFLVPKQGIYPVELTAKSSNGCADVKNHTYNANKGVELYVESAFTPGSNGINDGFLPKELKSSDVPFTFIVRNMSGEQVFESHDKYKAWNGSLNNVGTVLPAGQYLWTLVFEDDLGKKHNQKGTIKLLQK